MPSKKCGFGFNCGIMMLQPGLDPGDCPNYHTCGAATEMSPDEIVELYRVREEESRERAEERIRIQERIRVNRREAALLMLRHRGCPQSVEGLGIANLLEAIENRIIELWARLREFESGYIAPERTEIHSYNVKRSRVRMTQDGRETHTSIYWYTKLTAEQAIFEPSEKEEKVKVIHLSSIGDARHQEAKAGIERRNRLTKLRTQLRNIDDALTLALEICEEPESSS